MENNENIGVPTPETTNTQVPEKDYKHEYEKQLLEIEKLKNAISKTNSENAEYKRKELDKMTDDEKKAKEFQDLVESNNKMEAELKQMRLEKDLLANGFSAEESDKLIKGNFAVKDIADILKVRLEEQAKSIKAEMLKNTTPEAPMGNGTTTDPKQKSEFAKFQAQQEKNKTQGKVEF